jgi:hypothetical protein
MPREDFHRVRGLAARLNAIEGRREAGGTEGVRKV